jgi:hypothetical protein
MKKPDSRSSIAAAALLLFSSARADEPEVASWLNGDQLLAICSEATPMECAGYIEGVLDMMRFNEDASGVSLGVCVPEEKTKRQLIGVLVAYLQAHPAERRHTGVSETYGALRAAFPCAK